MIRLDAALIFNLGVMSDDKEALRSLKILGQSLYFITINAKY